ncbi:MAG: HAMP domain-containing sensor histidine kinase [Patescibacteria group bacterium]
MGSVTGLPRKYKRDPFFRTEVNIVFLQVLFSFAVITVMGAALALLYQSTLTSIIAHVQETILNAPRAGVTSLPIPTFKDVQSNYLLGIIAAAVGTAIVFGYLIARIALAPTRNALTSQKRFIGNVAHELRTPLSIIKTNTEVHLFEAAVSESARELHASTLEEIDRISNIINNLLTLNTLVRGEHIEFTEVDLGEVADEALKKLLPLARQKKISITKKAAEVLLVRGNRTALEQIAINILKNALAYTPQNGTVTISLLHEEGMVLLSISDSGVGIAEQDLPHIFEPYYRGDSSRTRATGGSGLGLAIVSELVQLHGGTIQIQSTLGHGTTVTVSIPSHTKERK